MRIASLLLLLFSAHAAARPNAPAPDQIRPLLIGQQIPDVAVQTADGATQTLRAVLAEQPSVLIFLRGGWCYFCNQQLNQLRLIQDAIVKTGYRVVVISGDPPGRLRAGLAGQTAKHVVLSDPTGEAARTLGLAYDALDEHFGTASNATRWRKAHGALKPWLPVPAVFLVHRSGLIVYEYINVDFKVRLSGEVLLTAAQVYAEPT